MMHYVQTGKAAVLYVKGIYYSCADIRVYCIIIQYFVLNLDQMFMMISLCMYYRQGCVCNNIGMLINAKSMAINCGCSVAG